MCLQVDQFGADSWCAHMCVSAGVIVGPFVLVVCVLMLMLVVDVHLLQWQWNTFGLLDIGIVGWLGGLVSSSIFMVFIVVMEINWNLCDNRF